MKMQNKWIIGLSIAMLMGIAYTNISYGMEPEQGAYKGLGGLPPELQVMMIQYLNIYENIDDVLDAIVATSLVDKDLNTIVNDMYGNPEGLTKLLHTLSKAYGVDTMEIANVLNTPAAQNYNALCKELLYWLDRPAVHKNTFNAIKVLVEEGKVDVNCTFDENEIFSMTPLLKLIVQFKKFEQSVNTPKFRRLHSLQKISLMKDEFPDKIINIINLLLAHGADPNMKDANDDGVFEYINDNMQGYSEAAKQKVRKVFEDAMKK